MMQAAIFHLVIEPGAVYERPFKPLQGDGQPYDWTGYTAVAKVRAAYDTPDPVVHLTDGDGIEFDEDGWIRITIPDTVTSTFDKAFKGRWDLKVISAGGTPYRVLEGNVTVDPEVSW